MKHDEARCSGQQMNAGVARSRRGAGHSLWVYGPHPRLGLLGASNSVAMVVMILFARFKVGIGTFLANRFRNQEGPTNLEYLNKGMKSVKSKEAGLVEAS